MNAIFILLINLNDDKINDPENERCQMMNTQTDRNCDDDFL